MALEEEAQICRLCGQCESIYIDVFGEEGTKRYLSLKIHTKVNILIDERDPLPKAICVQCLGKLEFVCDFQEECLRTQQLLRDRFNWPSPSDIDEIKVEDTPVSSVNNNNTNQNQNPPDIVINDADDIDCFKEEEQSSSWNVAPATTDNTPRILIDVKRVKPSSRNIPVEHHNGITITGNVVQSGTTSSTPLDILPNDDILSIQIPSTKNILPEFDIDEICRSVPIANRLRSQGNNSESNSLVTRHTLDRPRFLQENDDVIQIPTSALNKVLTTIANSDNTQVTVKESTSVNDANGDLNFLVELRRKKNAELVTILAKVFPDQGSCIVDRGAIIKLLENQNDSEMQAIVAKVLGQFNSNEDDINNGETKLVVGRNPEDLFRMDGEEISVEENIEQVSVENRTRYICRLCRKKYSRKDKCTVHVKTHLGIKQYLCTLCPAKFVCKSDVLKHIRSTHTNPRPFQCPKCPRRLRSKFDLIEHDNVHEGIKPYSCSECGLRYHHKVSLQMHAKSHLPSQNLACEYCGNVFPFRTRLLSHIASVHMKNRRNFRCHFCYNLYSSLSVLNNHIKSSHAATHVCEICGKEFKVKSKYKTHVLQHENPRPFSCPVCKNKYASRTFLSEHLSKHQGIRKHICQKCGATFAQASHLAAHRHVHGEKKYSCPDCGRRFNRQDNMKVHRKRHFKPASTRPKEQNRLPKQSPKENSTPPSSDITQDDGLSRKICMRCIGTLEFVTDFHNKCHQTQHQLLTAKEHSRKIANVDITAESDKENTLPADPLMQIGHKTTVITDSTARAIDSAEYDTSGCFRDCHGVAKYETIWTESRSNKRKKSESVIGVLEPKSLRGKEATLSSEYNNTILPKHKLRETRAQKESVDGYEHSEVPVSCIQTRKQVPKKIERSRSNCKKAPPSNSRETKVGNRIVTDNFDDEFNMKTAPMYAKKTVLAPLENVLAPISRELSQDFNNQPTTENLQPNGNVNKMQVKESQVFEEWLENKPVGKGLNIIRASQGYLETTTASQHLISFSKKLIKSVELNGGHFHERRKKSEDQFGKLSELITHEQKKVIETLYTINMDVVDNAEVYRNITILNKLKFNCKLCGKTYVRMDKCQVHVWGHLNMKPFSCKLCDFVTLTISNIRCHIRKRHLKIKPFQCNLCEKTYATAVLLKEHINSHTGAKPYLCKLCDFATANRQVLSYHRTTHKPAKDISCEMCDKKFFSNCRMRAHMITHNKDKALKCKLCSTYLCNAEALEMHCQKVHAREYICNICGLRTRTKKALTNHENVHSAAKYRCHLCSNVYKSRHMLKEHLLKHQGIRKYKCQLCQKSFAQQSHIAAHMSVHMGKRYPCPGCKKLFNRRDNMRMHTKRCVLLKSDPDFKNIFPDQSPTHPIVEDNRLAAVIDTDTSGTPRPTKSMENPKPDTEKKETGSGLNTTDLL